MSFTIIPITACLIALTSPFKLCIQDNTCAPVVIFDCAKIELATVGSPGITTLVLCFLTVATASEFTSLYVSGKSNVSFIG